MEQITYFVPETMTDAKKQLEETCSILIKDFNNKCKIEEQRLKDIIAERKKNRQYVYSVVKFDNGEMMLYKKATEETKMNDKDDEGWSVKFRILNGVLFHTGYHKSLSWISANNLIPQGLFNINDLDRINKDW